MRVCKAQVYLPLYRYTYLGIDKSDVGNRLFGFRVRRKKNTFFCNFANSLLNPGATYLEEAYTCNVSCDSNVLGILKTPNILVHVHVDRLRNIHFNDLFHLRNECLKKF